MANKQKLSPQGYNYKDDPSNENPFYTDEQGAQSSIPIASKTTAGIVKIGDGINVTADGTISAETGSGESVDTSNLVKNVSMIHENHVYTFNQEKGNTTSFIGSVEIPDIDTSNILAETSDSVVENTNSGYDFHTLSETEYNGTKNNIGHFYIARKQLTGIGITGHEINMNFVDQSGLMSSQQIELPLASTASPGLVKIGKNLTISSDGTLDADDQGSSYTLPVASSTTLGGVKVGRNLSVSDDGTISADDQDSSYTLPSATTTTLGGVKLGDYIHKDESDKLVLLPSVSRTLSPATKDALGVVKAGDGISISSDGTISTSGGSGEQYELPVASSDTLGGVKVGAGLSIASDGTLSASGGGGTSSDLPIATKNSLGAIRVGDGLSVTSSGILSLNLDENAFGLTIRQVQTSTRIPAHTKGDFFALDMSFVFTPDTGEQTNYVIIGVVDTYLCGFYSAPYNVSATIKNGTITGQFTISGLAVQDIPANRSLTVRLLTWTNSPVPDSTPIVQSKPDNWPDDE